MEVMRHILSTSLAPAPALPGMVIQQLGLPLKLNRDSAPLQRTPEPEDQITKISPLFPQLQQLKQKKYAKHCARSFRNAQTASALTHQASHIPQPSRLSLESTCSALFTRDFFCKGLFFSHSPTLSPQISSHQSAPPTSRESFLGFQASRRFHHTEISRPGAFRQY